MRSGRPTLIEAVLDSDRNPASILAACETDLAERGWRIYQTPGPVHGGFAASRLAEGRILRAGDAGAHSHDRGHRARRRPSTDVRMRLDWDMPRQMSSGRDFGASSGAERMPLLRAPSNVRFEALGAGGSTGRWTSDARVFTDRTVADLEAHFAQQLAAAGWQRVAGDADDVVGWSSWQVPGEGSWRGLLLVLAAFRADERSLTMRIEQDRPRTAMVVRRASSRHTNPIERASSRFPAAVARQAFRGAHSGTSAVSLTQSRIVPWQQRWSADARRTPAR